MVERKYISQYKRFKVLKRQRYRCAKCGCKLIHSGKSDFEGKVAHIDHKIPISKWDMMDGDPDDIKNLQGLCPDCNLSKSNTYCDISEKRGGMLEGEIYDEILRCEHSKRYVLDRITEDNVVNLQQLVNHLDMLRAKLSYYTNFKGKAF